jgi:exoribonuclease-2
MTDKNALVVYKNKQALVNDRADGKITISLQGGEQVKVRDKDIELIHPGPVKSLSSLESVCASSTAAREAWELLLSDEVSSISLKELSELTFGEYSPSTAWACFCLLQDGLYFSGGTASITPCGEDEVKAEEAKRSEKMRETGERSSFLERIKTYLKKPSENLILPEDARFMQDVEALALGKSPKSRAMRDLGLAEAPEDAHALLLNTGFWTSAFNPHPSRFGVSLNPVKIIPPKPPAQQRRDLTHLAAYAIDNSWSNDPDDAVSIEGNILYVHIADPAAAIAPDSPAEKEARDRGATLYLPEGAVRMFAEEALPIFALGFSETSQALTFQITLNENCEITETEIYPSVVRVKRITYEQADKEMEALSALYDLAQRNFKRRSLLGAVNIELPEVRICALDGKVTIEPLASCRSASLVRECMIIACEGAGMWAAARGLAFPYVSQEVELQGKIPSGMAGSYQLRRCMRPRVLSTKPGRHQGLGLDTYSQVTSPLRRYTDFLAHMQIRSFLNGSKPLGVDEVSARLGFCEAASSAVNQTERATNNHWTMVYLSDKKDSEWSAVALENKGNRWAVIIPSLALETQVPLQKDVLPNENIKLILKSANIARLEAVFVSKKG